VEEDAGRCAREARGRGDGQPVVAVAGADQGREAAGPARRVEQAGDVRAGRAGERPQPGVGAAEGLEAAQRAPPLVLGQDLGDAEPPREAGEVEEGVGA
jgi:hypothetical protein